MLQDLTEHRRGPEAACLTLSFIHRFNTLLTASISSSSAALTCRSDAVKHWWLYVLLRHFSLDLCFCAVGLIQLRPHDLLLSSIFPRFMFLFSTLHLDNLLCPLLSPWYMLLSILLQLCLHTLLVLFRNTVPSSWRAAAILNVPAGCVTAECLWRHVPGAGTSRRVLQFKGFKSDTTFSCNFKHTTILMGTVPGNEWGQVPARQWAGSQCPDWGRGLTRATAVCCPWDGPQRGFGTARRCNYVLDAASLSWKASAGSWSAHASAGFDCGNIAHWTHTELQANSALNWLLSHFK
jgi:hypothetical protein